MRRNEEGFTMIEVLVAMAIALVLIGALADLFSNSETASLATQRQSELVTIAQQQIEQIREEVKDDGFSALAMTSAPTVSTSLTSPDYYVTSGSGYYIETNWDAANGTAAAVAPNIATYTGTTAPAGAEPLCTSSGGFVSPSPTTVPEGSNTVQVWTIVTETTVGAAAATASSPCADDARRVIVAVKFVNSTSRGDQGPTTPLYMSTIFTNPAPTSQAGGAVGLSLGVDGINLG